MQLSGHQLHVVIRADAGRHIGTGHVMRCLTVAQELKSRGARVSFISRPFEGNLFAKIQADGFNLISLSSVATPVQQIVDRDYHLWFGTDPTTDAHETQAAIPDGTDILIVDHYAINDAWEKEMRLRVHTIMAIDDLANRRHDVDLLVDQNYVPAHEAVYKRLVNPDTELLCGPGYSLLRSEFQAAHSQSRIRHTTRSLLVFFGGIDAAGETTKVVRALVPLVTPELSVNVIIGSGFAARRELTTLIDRTPGFVLHEQVTTMARFMLEADLAIGAGGTTTWERCAVGLPALIVSIADNQRDIATGADELGIVEYLGHSSEISATGYQEAIRPFLGANSRLRQMSERALNITDGNGVKRVVDRLVAVHEGQKEHVL